MEIENTFSFQATVGHLQSFSNAHGGLQESTMPELRDNKLIIEEKQFIISTYKSTKLEGKRKQHSKHLGKKFNILLNNFYDNQT